MRLKTVLATVLPVLIFVASASAQVERPDPIAGKAQALAYVKLKVWLEGPYSTGSMTTSLNPTYLPLSQPYSGGAFSGTPMSYAGTEAVADWTGPRTAAVDWVLVEVRTTSAAVDSVDTRAGILLSDGSIKDTDGVSDLLFEILPGDYYVVVRHRNHIPIMSNGVVEFSGSSPTLYDLTIEGNIYSGVGAGGAKNLGSSVFGLYAGDANGSGGTGPEDQAAWLAVNGFTGYLAGDFNMSGGAGPEDQALWLGNPSRLTLVPEN